MAGLLSAGPSINYIVPKVPLVPKVPNAPKFLYFIKNSIIIVLDRIYRYPVPHFCGHLFPAHAMNHSVFHDSAQLTVG